jgi:hypothetical protein
LFTVTNRNKAFEKADAEMNQALSELLREIHHQPELEQHGNLLDALEKSAKAGDKVAVAKLNEQLHESLVGVAEVAMELAAIADTPERRHQILEDMHVLEECLPQQVEAAVAVAADPANEEYVEELEQAVHFAHETLDEIDAPQATLLEDANEAHHVLDEAVEAALSGHRGAFEESMKTVKAARQKLKKRVTWAAEVVDNEDRDDYLETMDELESDLFPAQDEALEELANHPDNLQARRRVEDLQDQIDEKIQLLMSPVGHVDPTEELIQKQKKQLDKLVDAAKRGDKKGVEALSKKLMDTNKKLVSRAKSDANSKKWDEPMRKKMFDTVAELDVLVPQEIALAQQIVAAPHHAGNAKKLSELDEKVRGKLNELSSGPTNSLLPLINDIRSTQDLLWDAAVSQKDPKVTQSHGQTLAKQAAQLAAKATTEAKTSANTNAERKKRLLEAADQCDTVVSAEIAAANQLALDPANRTKQQTLASCRKQTNALLNEMAQPALAVTCQLLDKLLTEFGGDVNKQQGLNSHAIAKTIVDTNEHLQDEGQQTVIQLARAGEPTKKKFLSEKLDEFDTLVPNLLLAVRASMERPQDVKHNQDTVEKLTTRGKQVLTEISQLVDPPREDRFLSAIVAAEKLTDQLLTGTNPSAASNNNNNNNNNTLQLKTDLNRLGSDLLHQVREEAHVHAAASDLHTAKQLDDLSHKIERDLQDIKSSTGDTKRAATNLKSRFNELRSVSQAVPNVVVRKVRTNNGFLVAAAKAADSEKVNQNAKAAAEASKELNDLLQSKVPGPAGAELGQQALSLQANLIAAAQKTLLTPDSPEADQLLDSQHKELLTFLDFVPKALTGKSPDSFPSSSSPSSNALPEPLKLAEEATNNLEDLVTQQASSPRG